MSARYEVVTSAKDQHFARFIAANGREVWRTSETYKRRKGAENAVSVVTGCFIRWYEGKATVATGGEPVEVRYIDDQLDEAAAELGRQAGTLPVKGACHVCGKRVSGERRFCGQCLRKRGRL